MTPDRYNPEAPHPQAALDLFKSEWSSAVPIPGTQSGHIDLFSDARIDWLIAEDAAYPDKTALELGPLEAGHTAMLEAKGYALTAVEANSRAYLKCLVVKELLGLRSRFLFGDLNEYLKVCPKTGLCVASGVLYHQLDPIRTLQLIAAKADRLLLWTHYYDPGICTSNLFQHAATVRHEPWPHTLHPRHYGKALDWDGFCGGPQPAAHWLSRADLLGAVARAGYHTQAIAFDHLSHPNGPCLALYAVRK